MEVTLEGSYHMVVATPEGVEVGRVNFIEFTLARTANDYGVLQLSTTDNRYLRRDMRYLVFRTAPNLYPELVTNTPFMLREVRRVWELGRWVYYLTCYSALHILSRRIVAYTAGSAGASKTAAGDDMLKQIVREAYTNNAYNTARTSSLLTVAPNTTSLPSITKAFSWRNVLETLQDIADELAEINAPVFFDVEGRSRMLEFKTYPQQRGTDRRYKFSRSAMVFSAERKNLVDIEITESFKDEVTMVYAGGKGEGAARMIGTATDARRVALSPFNLIEQFVDSTNSSTTAQLTGAAQGRLRQGIAKTTFSGTILETVGSRFMQDWNFGDYVSAVIEGTVYHSRINTIMIKVAEGKEVIEARIQA